MTFSRPKDVTLTNMAQWVDSIDLSDYDQDKLVEYLYHLSLYNAQQLALYRDDDTYDDFALFCVSKLMVRLTNKNIQPVKSVVNYIKTVLNPWYAEYVRCFCCGSADLQLQDFDISDFADYLVDASSSYDYNAYEVGCFSISEAIRKHMLQLPRKKHSEEWSNIYLSCLLTLQDRLNAANTLCENSVVKDDTQLISRMIRSLKTRPPVLFHIPDEWSNYVSVIVNEIIHLLSAELTYSTNTYVTPSTCLKNLIVAANNQED